MQLAPFPLHLSATKLSWWQSSIPTCLATLKILLSTTLNMEIIVTIASEEYSIVHRCAGALILSCPDPPQARASCCVKLQNETSRTRLFAMAGPRCSPGVACGELRCRRDRGGAAEAGLRGPVRRNVAQHARMAQADEGECTWARGVVGEHPHHVRCVRSCSLWHGALRCARTRQRVAVAYRL